ncbi:MAG: UDP-N-acetylmuramoyl-tripeptide--D-alanyl-D-alanine ligase [Patescibacteria group bacterium UBA2163]
MNIKETIRDIVVFILALEARAVLKRYRPKIIVVTGSVGKTSSKDAIYSTLSQHAFVRKSEKSFNADIGVPLTVLGVPNGWTNPIQWMQNIIDGFLLLIIRMPYPQWLVLEVGADRPGDISKSLSWLKPDIVVTTRFPEMPVHVEFYTSPEAVFEEEIFPLTQLTEGGVAVINSDDERSRVYPLKEGIRRISYGFSKDADIRATRYRVRTSQGTAAGISFSVHYKEETLPISVDGIIGETHVYAILAGIAGAMAAGAPFSVLESVKEAYNPPPGRLRLIDGSYGGLIIDDTYNASPTATEKALHTLQSVPTEGKRIAVLSDMLELGSYSKEEHKKIGILAHDLSDMLVVVGVRARHIAEGAAQAGMPDSCIHMFEKRSEAIAFLRKELSSGDTVLIKGSQSMRMEHVTKKLMKNPAMAEELLARQDPEWLIR